MPKKPIMGNLCGLKAQCVKALLQWATEKLKERSFETPRLDAEVLLAHAMKIDRLQLYLAFEDTVDKEIELYYRSMIAERLAYRPVSYLTGNKEFMSLDFIVNEDVLIPRPETETLVETVWKLGKAGSRVLELGTGSGAIAISLARRNYDWHIVATDLSMEAILVARENARLHDVIDRISFLQGDLFSAFSRRSKFDWVVSNPPYIPTRDLAELPPGIREYEPILALDGGTDGLSVIRRIIAEAYTVLKQGGQLAIEIGYGQSDEVQNLAYETGKYLDFSIVKDYSGIPRVFCCSLSGSLGK
jgi:release factor glutamine methyltransferase